MNVARVLTMVLCLALVLAACTKPVEEKPPATSVIEQLEPGAAVEHYAELVRVRRAQPIDFAKMTALYDNHLRAYVVAADGRYGTKLAAEATRALQAGAAGDNPVVSAQIAEKSIQRAFILTFLRSLDELAAGGASEDAYKRVVTSVRVIDAIALRRGKWAGKEREYADALQFASVRLFEAINSREQGSIAATAPQVADLARKMILLSVFYELQGLAKTRGTDADKASEKLVEARIYYDSLRPEHHRRNAKSAASVAKELARTPDQINIALLGTILRNDFLGELIGIEPHLLGG